MPCARAPVTGRPSDDGSAPRQPAGPAEGSSLSGESSRRVLPVKNPPPPTSCCPDWRASHTGIPLMCPKMRICKLIAAVGLDRMCKPYALQSPAPTRAAQHLCPDMVFLQRELAGLPAGHGKFWTVAIHGDFDRLQPPHVRRLIGPMREGCRSGRDGVARTLYVAERATGTWPRIHFRSCLSSRIERRVGVLMTRRWKRADAFDNGTGKPVQNA